MAIDNALASVAVKDIKKAAKWYEKVLGRPADFRPMPEVAEWKFPGGGGLQVYQLAERAGSGSLTLPVSRIDDEIAKLEQLDIDTHQRTSSPKVKTVMVTDPDGNHIAFAESHDPAMLGGDSHKAGAPARGASGALEHLHFPGESAAYRTARNALLDEEIALRRQVERVAAQRRALPPGGLVTQDYVFEGLGADGQPVPIKLSELFAPGKDSLALYSFMYGPERKRPCPGCTHFLDSFDGVARHAPQRINLYIVAKSPLARLLALARERGWNHLVFLSTAGNTYDKDYYGDSLGLTPAMRKQQDFKDGEEWDMPILNVFRREGGGAVRHTWGQELLYVPPEPGQEYRHNDLLDPLWNLFDMVPEGRGDFHAKLSY